MTYKKPRMIAEAGCNHKGDMAIAKKLIIIAAVYCNADVIKFQKRNNRELLTEKQYNAPHPNLMHAYGNTYGEHREFLEFDVDQHKQLKDWCEEYGIEYSTSVWDLTSAKEIAQLKPQLIKIPSACNNHYKMLNWLCDNYSGEIHLSMGMTNHSEEDKIVELFEKNHRHKDLVLYSCTSGYPVPYKDVSLLEICRLKEKFENRIKEVAFSGHHLGIAMDVAAYALGATTIERHFTLDRNWKGTDHGASLEPSEMQQLSNDLQNTYLAMSFKENEILEIEKIQREKLKYREN